MAMSTEDRVAAQQGSAAQAAAIAANGGVDPGLTAQYGITDPDLAKYLVMAAMPQTIAWGDPSAGGSRSQEQAAARAATQFAQAGGQAELDRIKAKIQANPTLNSQLQAVITAGNKGDFFSKIGDTVVKLTPVALQIAAIAAGADIAMGGSLFAGGAGAGGATGGGMMSAPTGLGYDALGTSATGGMMSAPGAAADTIASMTGAGTGVSDLAAYSSAMGADGAMMSGSLGNAATGLGYDALGTAATGGMMSATSPALQQAAQTLAQAGITPEQVAANSNNPTWLKSVTDATGLPASAIGQIASTGLGMLGSALAGSSTSSAAQTSANAQIEAARIAADAAKFRPVGVTTRFGSSNFGYDANGNLNSAGYTLSPELKSQQDALMSISGSLLNQYQVGQVAAAPMGQTAEGLFGLGQSYLSTTPQAQASKYMSEQQALLAPSRERELAALNAKLQAQGRGGLAVGGTSSGMMAANPELEAFYNAQRMQDLQLASQSTQGGMDYAKFGAGLVGTGGDLLKGMYGTQSAAFDPYQTAIGGVSSLEALGQQPMDLGTSIGAKSSTSSAQAGLLQAKGITNAANTMQPANSYSPWGAMLTGAGQAVGQYSQPQQPQQYKFDPYTGRAY